MVSHISKGSGQNNRNTPQSNPMQCNNNTIYILNNHLNFIGRFMTHDGIWTVTQHNSTASCVRCVFIVTLGEHFTAGSREWVWLLVSEFVCMHCACLIGWSPHTPVFLSLISLIQSAAKPSPDWPNRHSASIVFPCLAPLCCAVAVELSRKLAFWRTLVPPDDVLTYGTKQCGARV